MSESMGKNFGKIKEDLRRIDQRIASLEQDARQPRLAMEVDVKADKKTRERTEGAATAVQAKYGDSCSAKRVQADPTSSTSFGVKDEPPALPCRDDVLVENGATAPKSCLLPLEMRTPTAFGGLLPAGKSSTTTRGSPFTSRIVDSAKPRRRILRERQFNTPRTRAVSGG